MKNNNPSSPFCLICYRYIKNQLVVIHEQANRLKIGSNIEHLHKTRVATRRLRAALYIFSSCLQKKEFKKLLSETKKLTKQLGVTRDVDVQIQFLNKFNLELKDEKYHYGIERLIWRKGQIRVKSQKKVDRAISNFLNNNFAKKVNSMFKKNLKGVRLYKKVVRELIYDVEFSSLITNKINKVLSFDIAIRNPERVKELHQLRILIKRLRYTLEIFLPFFETELKGEIFVIKEMQNTLGQIHDCDVWIDYLPKFLEQEKNKTIKYFGYQSPINSVYNGIYYLRNNRIKERNQYYSIFIEKWIKLLNENFWDKLLHFPVSINTQAPVP